MIYLDLEISRRTSIEQDAAELMRLCAPHEAAFAQGTPICIRVHFELPVASLCVAINDALGHLNMPYRLTTPSGHAPAYAYLRYPGLEDLV